MFALKTTGDERRLAQLAKPMALAGWITAALAAPAAGQQVTTGVVIDSSERPLSGVAVFVDDVTIVAHTDGSGFFELPALAPGSHQMFVRGAGYGPRDFALPVDGSEPTRYVGTIVLEPDDPQIIFVRGRVTDRATATTLAAVQVFLNGDPAGMTDANGTFMRQWMLPWGRSKLETLSFGFQYSQFYVDYLHVTDTLDVHLAMDPVPFELPEIRVEGDRALAVFGPRMRGFYERLDRGLGDFLTAREIEERNPVDISDMLRVLPYIQIPPSGSGDREIRFRTNGFGPCLPLLFVDDALVLGTDINTVIRPQNIAAIEVYRGAVLTPAQFSRGRTACGSIVIWTR